jgi:hypothetical protein
MSPITLFKNGNVLLLAKLLLAFALGAGTAVAAAYNTFETGAAHQLDQARTEQMLEEIRGDIKTILSRTAPNFRIPKVPLDPGEGYGAPPRPQKQAEAPQKEKEHA